MSRRPSSQPARGRRGDGRRPARISWGRRIGLLAGLLLAGAGVVFAGQALRGVPDGAGTAPPGGTASPGAGTSNSPASTMRPGLPAAPALDPPEPVTAAEAIVLTGRLADVLPAGGGPYRLRIYVNDRLERDVRIGRQDVDFRVANVPLARGQNSIRAAVAGTFGETLHSPAVVVQRDDEPPALDLLEPRDGAVAYEETQAIRGTTEPGAVVTLSNPAAGSGGSALAGSDGAFALSLVLVAGINEVVLTARDTAGNGTELAFRIELRENAAGASIELSRDMFDLSKLPATISVSAHLTGVDGEPIDGLEVIFSISAPGHMTSTHSTTARQGVARWLHIPLPREGAVAGRGLVTVLVTLPDGQELRNSASFTFR